MRYLHPSFLASRTTIVQMVARPSALSTSTVGFQSTATTVNHHGECYPSQNVIGIQRRHVATTAEIIPEEEKSLVPFSAGTPILLDPGIQVPYRQYEALA